MSEDYDIQVEQRNQAVTNQWHCVGHLNNTFASYRCNRVEVSSESQLSCHGECAPGRGGAVSGC